MAKQQCRRPPPVVANNLPSSDYRGGEIAPAAPQPETVDSEPIGRTTGSDGATAEQPPWLSQSHDYQQNAHQPEPPSSETRSAELIPMLEATKSPIAERPQSSNSQDLSDHFQSRPVSTAARLEQVLPAQAQPAEIGQSHSRLQYVPMSVVSQEPSAHPFNGGSAACEHSEATRGSLPSANGSLLARVGGQTNLILGTRHQERGREDAGSTQCAVFEVAKVAADGTRFANQPVDCAGPPSTQPVNPEKSVAGATGFSNQGMNQARPWTIEAPSDSHSITLSNFHRHVDQLGSEPTERKLCHGQDSSQALTTRSFTSKNQQGDKEPQPTPTHRGGDDQLTLMPQETQKSVRSWEPIVRSQSPAQAANPQGGGSDCSELANRKSTIASGGSRSAGWVGNPDERSVRPAKGQETRTTGSQAESQGKEQPAKPNRAQAPQSGAGPSQPNMSGRRIEVAGRSDAGWVTQPNRQFQEVPAVNEIGTGKSTTTASAAQDTAGKNPAPRNSTVAGTGNEIASHTPSGRVATAAEWVDNSGSARRTVAGPGPKSAPESTVQSIPIVTEIARGDRVCQNIVTAGIEPQVHGSNSGIATAPQNGNERTLVYAPGAAPVQVTSKGLDEQNAAQTSVDINGELPLQPGQAITSGKYVLGNALKQAARRVLAEDLGDRSATEDPNIRVSDFSKRAESSNNERNPMLRHNLPETAPLCEDAPFEPSTQNEVTWMLKGFAIIDEDKEDTEPVTAGSSTASVTSSQPQIVTYLTKLGDTLNSIAIAAWCAACAIVATATTGAPAKSDACSTSRQAMRSLRPEGSACPTCYACSLSSTPNQEP